MKLNLFATLLLTAITCFSGSFAFGQPYTFEFAKAFGGSSPDYADAVVTDSHGNIYIAGTFEETVDFDPGNGIFNLTAVNGAYNTAFVQKLTPKGEFIWAKQYGGIKNEIIGIEIDSDDNIYITGNFGGTGDFNPNSGVNNLSSNGNSIFAYNIFLLKLDENGQYQWAANFGGSTEDKVGGICIDSQDNLYLTGTFTGTSDFDPSGTAATVLSANIKDAFVLKIDKDRNFQWVRQLPYSTNSGGTAITNDDFGNIYMTGSFRDSVHCDANGSTAVLYSNGFYSSLFVLKIDTSNTFQWIKYVDNSTTSQVLSTSIATDSVGNVYTVGTYDALIDLDPDTSVFNITSITGITNSFIQKLDSSGQFVWAKALRGTSHNTIYDIEISEQGAIYTTGKFSGSADFDPNSTAFTFVITVMDIDVFVQSLDLDGNFLWAKKIGSTFPQIGKDLHLDHNAMLHLVGAFKGIVDLNPDAGVQMAAAHNYDCFLLSLRPLVANDLELSELQFTCDTGFTFLVHNRGLNVVDSFEIGWAINNIPQVPIVIHDSLSLSDSLEIHHSFLLDNSITSQVNVWVNTVNNNTDNLTYNDSIAATFLPHVPILILDTMIYSWGEIWITPSGDASSYSYLWSTGDTTQNLYNTWGTGLYYLTITSSYGCSDTFSFQVDYDNTDFVYQNDLIQLSLYPNPVAPNQLLMVTLDAILPEDINYQILNAAGQLIQKGILNANALKHEIPSPLQTGLYYLQLTSNNQLLKTVAFTVH